MVLPSLFDFPADMQPVSAEPNRLDDQAIAWANDVPYGLASSVFSQNVGRALSAAKRLEFGTVWVNEHLFPLASEMPHGGFKQSGNGKDMSSYALEEYTEIKHVMINTEAS